MESVRQDVILGLPEVQKGYSFKELEEGDSRTHTREITEDLLIHFARASGDWNPLHFDEIYAQETLFEGRVAHGMLTESIFSGMIGMEFPGQGSIVMRKTTFFKRPVRIGDVVCAQIVVRELKKMCQKGYGAAVLAGRCTVRGKVVLEGEVEVLVPV